MRKYLVFLIALLLVAGTPHQRQDDGQRYATWRIESSGPPIWVTIVSSSTDLQAGIPDECEVWWRCGNTHSDTYLFAVGNRDNVRLILEFSRNESDQAVAHLYVADAGQSRLDFEIVGDAVRVDSYGGAPYLTLRTRQGSWVEPYGTNYDLDILLDGAYNGGEYGNPHAKTDGIVDFRIATGSETPGVPQWQTNTISNDAYTPAERSWPRFIAFLRMKNAPTFAVAEPFMPTFPYLGIGDTRTHWTVENPLPITLDTTAIELRLAPFVGFQNGGMYTINSITLPPHVNFEAPFGFYTFDRDTRQPHLVVRGGYFPARSNLGEELPSPRLGIRYSWKMHDEQRWQYGLQLSDFHTYSKTLTVGSTELIVPQPEEFPDWVMSRSWRAVTFVESVDGYSGSEGIYFYSVDDEDWLWLSGDTNTHSGYIEAPLLQESTAVTKFFGRTLPAGFRGEYVYASTEPPELYFSSVDRMLHLLSAEGGIWNLGDGIILRSMDLRGDGVIDTWMRELVPPMLDEESGLPRVAAGEETEALFDLKTYLLHREPGRFTIVHAPHEQIAFTISPPTNKDAWQAFRTQLHPYQNQRRDPTDLGAWLDAFSGTPSEIAGGAPANVRFTDDGFRFELSLEPGFQITGPDLLGVMDLSPGNYVVENSGGTFTVAPLVPAELHLDVRQLVKRGGTAAVQIAVHNAGTADASDLTLVVEAVAKDGTVVDLTRERVEAHAGETSRLFVDIPSSLAGTAILRTRLAGANGQIVAVADPIVLAKPHLNRGTILSIWQTLVLMAVLGLFGAFVAGAAMLAIARRWGQPIT